MLNLGLMQTQISNMIERTDASFLTRITGYINQRYRNIAKRRPWIDLCRQLTVVENVSNNYIILPSWVSNVIDIHQTDTPVVIALQRYFNFINRHINDYADTGNPFIATPVGRIGLAVLMPSNSVITIVSSSSSDVTQTIRVKGYDSTNLVGATDSIAINGTTPVAGTVSFSSTGGYEPWFSKSGNTVGTISIKSGSTVLATLGPQETDAAYTKWALHPAPSQANNLYVTLKKEIVPLINSEDVPEIRNCEDAIIQGAYAQCLEEKRMFQKAAQAWQHYEDEITQLIQQEPVFQENFQDQLLPEVVRNADDLPYGGTNFGVR